MPPTRTIVENNEEKGKEEEPQPEEYESWSHL